MSIVDAVGQFRVPGFQFSDLQDEPRRGLGQSLRVQLLTIKNADNGVGRRRNQPCVQLYVDLYSGVVFVFFQRINGSG